MRRSRNSINAGNFGYQHSLANSFIHSLGVEGATDICLQNSWAGTLKRIKFEENRLPAGMRY
jgi:hypothetical protein